MGLYKATRDFYTAIAYFFFVQAVFPEGPTSQEHFVPSILVFSKISKILTQENLHPRHALFWHSEKG